jgi:hypothetical protein
VDEPIDAGMGGLTAAGRAWLRAVVDRERRRAVGTPPGRKTPLPFQPAPPRPEAMFEHQRRNEEAEDGQTQAT